MCGWGDISPPLDKLRMHMLKGRKQLFADGMLGVGDLPNNIFQFVVFPRGLVLRLCISSLMA